MIKGIIFDMDGVIIDSNGVHFKNWNTVFRERYGIEIPRSEFASRLGESSKHFTEYFVGKYKIKDPPEFVLGLILERYTKGGNDIKLKNGVKATLERLHGEYKIALATGANKEWALLAITSLGVAEFFDYVVAGNEVKRAKPDPEIFLKAAEMLGLRPSECVVVEDAEMGLIAAKSAGMTAISVPDEMTVHQDHSMADFHLKSLSEIDKKLFSEIKP